MELYGRPASGADGRMGFMPQRDQLFEWRSIYDNVMLGLQIRNDRDPAHRRNVEGLLKRYGLWEFAAKRPDQLSGGMRQRCALIRTLATQPDILLLDEPFSELDYQTRLAVSGDIWHIIRSEGKTALLVTHDISEAVSMSDRVVVLSRRPATVKAVFDMGELRRMDPLKRRRIQPLPAILTPYGRSWSCVNEPALSPKRARYLHRLRQESRRVRLWQAALFVGFFAFWELSCRVGLSDGFLVSSPSRVAATFLTLCRGGDVLVHVGVSCWETVVGFLLGTAAGTVVAGGGPPSAVCWIRIWWCSTPCRKRRWVPSSSSGWAPGPAPSSSRRWRSR